MKFSAAIIGLGNIGMGYDANLPVSTHILSHARALHLHPGFELVGAVEIKPEIRATFIQNYKAPAFSTIEELLKVERPKCLVVANSTGMHLITIEEVLQRYKPLAIMCEKPLSGDRLSAQAIVDTCKKNYVGLFVNFIRRADPAIREVKKRIKAGVLKPPYKVVVWYSKGLMHNGSHFIDLLSFWFGAIRRFSIIDQGRSLNSFGAEPDVRFEFENANALIIAAMEENFSHYTVEIVCSNGRLRYEKSGTIYWQEVVPHPTLGGYRQLGDKLEYIAGDMSRYQINVAEQLYKALKGHQHSLCTGEEALLSQQWIEKACYRDK